MYAPRHETTESIRVPLKCALCRLCYHECISLFHVSRISGCSADQCETCDIDGKDFRFTNALMEKKFHILAADYHAMED